MIAGDGRCSARRSKSTTRAAANCLRSRAAGDADAVRRELAAAERGLLLQLHDVELGVGAIEIEDEQHIGEVGLRECDALHRNDAKAFVGCERRQNEDVRLAAASQVAIEVRRESSDVHEQRLR